MKIAGLLILGCLILSCNHTDKKIKVHPELANPPPITPESIRIIPDSIMRIQVSGGLVDYWLFIPAGLDTASHAPVVFFADPAAAGSLPVRLYGSLSEKYGLILAGSNLSKNGQPANENARHLAAMVVDVAARSAIDKNRMCLAGFSGGSRVASFVALQTGQFQTVIAAGAGMMNPEKTTAARFYYIGMVGRKDFNYQEMLQQHNQFAHTGLHNDLIIFGGPHEWPPSEAMDKALALMTMESMHGMGEQEVSLTEKEYRHTLLNDLARLKNEKRFTELKILYDQGIRNAAGLSRESKWQDAYEAVLKSVPYKEAEERFGRKERMERNLMTQYGALLGEKDAGWWVQEMKMLDAKANNPGQAAEMYSRIIAYVRLAAYMHCDRYVRSNEHEAAHRLLNVYEAVDPLNPEAAYLKAVVFARQGLVSESVKLLGKSARLGHKKSMGWKEDPEFNRISRSSLDSLAGGK